MSLLVIPLILEQVVSAMNVTGVSNINFQIGRLSDIIKSQTDMDNSLSFKDKKYPMVSMEIPIREISNAANYTFAIYIPKIVISNIGDGTSDMMSKYQTGGVFLSILYPMFYEFLNQLSLHPLVNTSDPTTLKYQKLDNPGVQPIIPLSNDFVDAIEIVNLEFQILKSVVIGNSGSTTNVAGSGSTTDAPIQGGCI